MEEKTYYLYPLYPYLIAGIICLFLFISNIIIFIGFFNIIKKDFLGSWYSYSFGLIFLLLGAFFFLFYNFSRKRKIVLSHDNLSFNNFQDKIEYSFNYKDINYICYCRTKNAVKKYSNFSRTKKNFYPYGIWFKNQFIIVFNKPLLINTMNITDDKYRFNHFYFKLLKPEEFIENNKNLNIYVK